MAKKTNDFSFDIEVDNGELAHKVEKFKKGEGDMPTIVLRSEVKSENGEMKMILTKEIYDRDGEMIDLDGMDIENFMNNPVLLDAHQMTGSVVSNVLGRVTKLKKTKDVDGVRILMGVPEFAPSPNGQIAKSLVENGFARTVSVGFGVKDYDHERRVITASELYEVSLVSVPSNVQAIISKGLKLKDAKEEVVAEKLEATLNNYKDIHSKIKQYRALFMADDIFSTLKVEKTGDEILDLKRLYDTLILRLKEVENQQEPEKPQEQVENPPSEQVEQAEKAEQAESQPDKKEDLIYMTREELQDLVRQTIHDTLIS